MKNSLPLALLSLALPVAAAAAGYQVVPDWLKLPAGWESVGNQHGSVSVSRNGEVYVSIMSGKQPGVQVYSADGRYLRNVPKAPADFHGFVIHQDADGKEYLYGSRLGTGDTVKLTLDGKVALTIPGSAIPDEFKKKTAPKGKPRSEAKAVLRLTDLDVAPNGDLFISDGYSNDYVHHFDKTGKYLKSFGGRGKAPYNFNTLHKIAVDTRFSPPRIIGCDRGNMRVVHLSLEGEFLGVIAKDMLLPAAVAIHGDLAAIGEIKGRVTLLDKAGKVVARLGTNEAAAEVGTNKTEPAKWRPGIVTAPHGVAFNSAGDLFVSEYSVFGRVHRWNRQ